MVLLMSFGISVSEVTFAAAEPLNDVVSKVENVAAPLEDTARSALPERTPAAVPTAPEVTRTVPDQGPSGAGSRSSPSSEAATTLSSAAGASRRVGGLPSTERSGGNTTQAAGPSASGAGDLVAQAAAPAGRSATEDPKLRRAVPADKVPLRWFFVYVWRAIALGQDRAL